MAAVPRALKVKKGEEATLRPTLSKVREALFNILVGRVEGAVFVDLYAGTGAVGMDAMARGAEAVYFVEADKKRAARLRELLEGCGCRPRAHILPVSAAAFLKKMATEGLKADIIFLDPPYESEELQKVLPVIGQGIVLAEDGVVVAEHATRSPLPGEYGVLVKKKDYRYGDTTLTLYKRSA